jgi:NADPH:quinone reductase-like Zn-dependent oxidoreductase
MKAAIYRRYGPPDVVQIEEIDTPIPKQNEVLVRIHATTVCAPDWRLRKAEPFPIRIINGLTAPKKFRILGVELAGTIEAVGEKATRFRVGDQVFGSAGMKFGAHAEYVCLPETGRLAMKPANLSFAEAAAIPFGGVSALHFLRKAKVGPGQNVLIYGASGSVGTAAVQLAKHFGARVTAVCGAANLDMVKSLGADEVIDYAREDFSKAGRVYDVIVDTVGKSGFSRSLRSLKRGGAYALVMASPSAMLQGLWASSTGDAKVIQGMARLGAGDLAFLAKLYETGAMKTVIGRRYALNEIAEAHRYAESGHKQGNAVIVLS